MANETLSIQKDDARLTVIGKSKAETYIDSGLGLDLDDLDIGSLDPLDLNWQTDVPDNLPDEIRIITQPIKLQYYNKQKIDVSGMVVGAYRNGSIWTNSKYPNGHIPLNELFISPLIAKSGSSPSYDDLIAESTFPSSMDKSKVKIYSPGSEFLFYYGLSGTYQGSTSWTCKSYYIKANDDGRLCIIADFADDKSYAGTSSSISINSSIYVDGSIFTNPEDYPLNTYYSGSNITFSHFFTMFATSNKGTSGFGYGDGAGKDDAVNSAINSAKPGGPYTFRYDYSKDGKTVFFPNMGFDYYDRNLIGDIAWKVLYGDYGGYPVTVAWERPGDRIVLSTSFKISVVDSGGGGGR